MFFHEALRQFGDRILMRHDYKWFVRALKAVCCQHFLGKDLLNFDFTQIVSAFHKENESMFDGFPVEDPEQLWFSVLNDEVEGCYM
jgi:hypothetical protein